LPEVFGLVNTNFKGQDEPGLAGNHTGKKYTRAQDVVRGAYCVKYCRHHSGILDETRATPRLWGRIEKQR
jgi:hypothetical protein